MFVQVTVRESPHHPQTMCLSSLLSTTRKAALMHNLKLSLFSMADKFYFVPNVYRRQIFFFLLVVIFLSVKYLCFHSSLDAKQNVQILLLGHIYYTSENYVSHLVFYFLGKQYLKLSAFYHTEVY